MSPKGIDTFRCINDQTVAYLDLTGSGNETSAHLQENGRMTIMFCSFSEQPLILRLYGQGKVIRPRDRDWETFIPISRLCQENVKSLFLILILFKLPAAMAYPFMSLSRTDRR